MRQTTPGAASPEKFAASAAAGEVSNTRINAIRILRETADPALGQRIAEATQSANAIEAAIRSRQEIIGIDAAIVRHEARVNDLAAGKRDYQNEPADRRGVSTESLYTSARRRLNETRALAAQKPEAERANQEDRERIASLHQQIAELEEKRLDPANMLWHQ